MVAFVRPLNAAQAQRFAASMDHLRGRRHRQALDLARALSRDAPDSADAQQLLAMCLAETGDAAGADAAFHAALALAPGNAQVALNAATWWRRSGREAAALAVLEGLTESAPVRTQQGLAALQSGDAPRARSALERAVQLDPMATAAWHGLANALRALGELDAAEAAARQVVALAPMRSAGWFNLGSVLREAGRAEDALQSLRRAQALGDTSPELRDAIHGVLHDLGRPADALLGARQLVAEQPAFAPGQQTLASLLWENGDVLAPGEDPFAALHQAASEHLAHRDLQCRYLGMLLSAKRAVDALAWLEALRSHHPEDPLLGWFEASALDALGRDAEATARFEALQGALGNDPEFLNAHARHAFRVGKPDLAQACAERAVGLDPANQEGWSHLGLAWRLAGDPREAWLCDYERLVGYLPVDAPDGLPGDAFLAALRRTLEGLHLASREPVNQSVRHGSQTGGRLFGRADPVLQTTERALRSVVERWLAQLPDDPHHPFLSRKRRSVRFVGSWSVRLKSSGRHSNHIHNEGWMSSAYYVALPKAIAAGGAGAPHAGWIQFGQPLEELGLDLPPRRLLQPREGHLALFPSYFWHGTAPFEDPEPRLTVAFDMQPRS
jgi:Flp pilus assembly protein TadD